MATAIKANDLPVHRVMVALAPGETHAPAIDRVKALAHVWSADVLLYCAVFDKYLTNWRSSDRASLGDFRETMIAAERSKIEEVANHLEGLTRSIEVRVEWQHPVAEGVNRVANEFGAELVIASSRHHSRAARWLLTNTDWDVLARTSTPVLLAHHRAFRPYKKTVIAVDPLHAHGATADLDGQLIDRGGLLAAAFDGELHLAHALGPPHTIVGDALAAEVTAEWVVERTHAVEDLANGNGIDTNNVHMLEGYPNAAIASLANYLDVDLVVIGGVSRSFVERLMIGPTTERVIDQLDCDVLVVHPPGRVY